MPALLLWDIDGTILSSSGSGLKAIRLGLLNHFNINDLIDDIDFSGRTDRWIMRQIFAKHNIPATEENFSGFIEAYLKALPEQIAVSKITVFPGVKKLLHEGTQKEGIHQGLLTGNLHRGAKIKLGQQDLWKYFPMGAFCDDSEFRNDLVPYGMMRAMEHFKIAFKPSEVWIIGDTPHDIACAKVIGAHVIAVATGHHDVEELSGHNPTATLPDLSNTDAFWDLITKHTGNP
ncbi:MAG: HAD family hydrolase [Verrucomicrobiota bacterium]|jgi:phosphoglycolate phosphatase-like HAD superfamily hydrolase|nr:MAG: HAD hydrolase-like protein [Verrucomicrobiota bacterium]